MEQFLTIQAFGQLAEITGCSSFDIKFCDNTATLQQLLQQRYPGLAAIPYAIAVNRKVVSGAEPILPFSSIALLPPFSGG